MSDPRRSYSPPPRLGRADTYRRVWRLLTGRWASGATGDEKVLRDTLMQLWRVMSPEDRAQLEAEGLKLEDARDGAATNGASP